MPRLHVLRVFCDADGAHGNPLGVFLDGGEVPAAHRQRLAHRLGFSETVFVDDRDRGELRVFTPGQELPFAGHPTVGAAWLLAREGAAPVALRPPAGEVAVRREGKGEAALVFVAARAAWSPPWSLIELPDPAAVAALAGPPGGRRDPVCAWAWEERAGGRLRCRCWALEAGVGEDEATGSAALVLAAARGRELTIRQGEGSLLRARPLGDGWAEVGGRVRLDAVRDQPL